MIDPISQSSKPPPDPVQIQSRLQTLHSSAVDFEAVLIGQMFQNMENTLKDGGLVGSGTSGSVYSGILTEAVSKSMAETQSIGLAPKLFDQIVAQEPDLKDYVKTHCIDWTHPQGILAPGSETELKKLPSPTALAIPNFTLSAKDQISESISTKNQSVADK